MPRGIPKNKRGGRRAAAAEVEEETVETPTLIPPSGAVPAGQSIGAAIEQVRSALEPFDTNKRKAILKAVNAVLK
jgi:hypothetical protein